MFGNEWLAERREGDDNGAGRSADAVLAAGKQDAGGRENDYSRPRDESDRRPPDPARVPPAETQALAALVASRKRLVGVVEAAGVDNWEAVALEEGPEVGRERGVGNNLDRATPMKFIEAADQTGELSGELVGEASSHY